MFGISIATASRPEVRSTSSELVTFAANSAAREAPRAAETAVQCIQVRDNNNNNNSNNNNNNSNSSSSSSSNNNNSIRLVAMKLFLISSVVSQQSVGRVSGIMPDNVVIICCKGHRQCDRCCTKLL